MDGRQMGGFQGLGENGKYEWVGVSSGGGDEDVLKVQGWLHIICKCV